MAAPIESFDSSAPKRSHIARWILIGSLVAVIFNIVWTCILVSTQLRQAPDFQTLTDTLIDTVNQFKVKITQVDGVTRFLVQPLSNNTSERNFCQTRIALDGTVT